MTSADEGPSLPTPDWVQPVFEEALDLKWETQGDEWLHHVMALLGEIVPMTGHSRSWRGDIEGLPYPPHYEIRATSETLRSALRVVLFDQALFLFVTGEGDPDADQFEPWLRAIQAARERLGGQQDVFAWLAVVGTTPGLDENVAVEEAAEIGPLRITPTDKPYFEWIRTTLPSLSTRQGFSSSLAAVSGESKGFDWFKAGHAAARDLRRLCGLLSVVTSRAWTLRQVPIHPVPSEFKLPEFGPGVSSDEMAGPYPSARVVKIPSWVTEAWATLDADPELDRVLSSHLEGLLMQYTHPSFAMVAFVGALETLGARVTAETGLSQRFRAALAKVVQVDEAKRLASAYGRRSGTAHAGKLHGSEGVFDFMSYPSMFVLDPALEFAYRELRYIRDASGSALELALTGSLSA